MFIFSYLPFGASGAFPTDLEDLGLASLTSCKVFHCALTLDNRLGGSTESAWLAISITDPLMFSLTSGALAKPPNVVSFFYNSRLLIIRSRSSKMFLPSSSPTELKFSDSSAIGLAGLSF